MRGLDLGLGLTRSIFGRPAAPALPTSAVLVQSGARFDVAPGILAVAGLLTDFFVSMWVRIDSQAEQYTSHLTAQGGEYLWLGTDYTAAGGDRNLAYYDSHGGGLGGHARGAYGATGVWRHLCWSVLPDTVKGWFDGVPCDWDSSTSPHYEAVIGGDGWPGTTGLRLLNESGSGQDFVGGVRAIALGRKNGAVHLTTEEVLAQMMRSKPFEQSGSSLLGFTTLGCWPLTTSADLGNAISGGPALTLTGSLGADTTGPSGITQP
jgi:hypothetical protein